MFKMITQAWSLDERGCQAIRKRLQRARKFGLLVQKFGTADLNAAPHVSVSKVDRVITSSKSLHRQHICSRDSFAPRGSRKPRIARSLILLMEAECRKQHALQPDGIRRGRIIIPETSPGLGPRALALSPLSSALFRRGLQLQPRDLVSSR